MKFNIKNKSSVVMGVVALATTFEGFSHLKYKDVVGKMTTGFGHLITGRETSTNPYILLQQDAERAVDCVNKNVTKPLNDNQKIALSDLAFNIGCSNFQKSGALRAINNGTFKAERLELYNKAGGLVYRGLTLRRKAEECIFRGGDIKNCLAK